MGNYSFRVLSVAYPGPGESGAETGSTKSDSPAAKPISSIWASRHAIARRASNLLMLMFAGAAVWIAGQQYGADQQRDKFAAQESRNGTEVACAQLSVDLRARVREGLVDPAKLLSDLRVAMKVCDRASSRIRDALVEDVRQVGARSDGEIARVASQAESKLMRPRPAPSAKAGDPAPKAPDVVPIVPYDGGAATDGTGLLNFKTHVDNPSANELRKALGPGPVGVGLLAPLSRATSRRKGRPISVRTEPYSSSLEQAASDDGRPRGV